MQNLKDPKINLLTAPSYYVQRRLLWLILLHKATGKVTPNNCDRVIISMVEFLCSAKAVPSYWEKEVMELYG